MSAPQDGPGAFGAVNEALRVAFGVAIAQGAMDIHRVAFVAAVFLLAGVAVPALVNVAVVVAAIAFTAGLAAAYTIHYARHYREDQ